MSQILIQSPKHCAAKGRFINLHKFHKKLFISFSAIFTSILCLILLIYLILHPSKPQFTLKEADLFQLNLSGSPTHLLNCSLQLTLHSKNPNQKVGIYYDDVQAYAAYKGQQITLPTSLPPFYQGHEDSNIISASLVGAGLPVASSFGYEVGRDQTAGRLVLNFKVDGKIRWKVGTWVSGHYRFNVNCVAVLPFNPGSSLFNGPLSLKQGTQCSTSV